jgi:hypothetical protein
LIGSASAQTADRELDGEAEALSITRLEGSRWRGGPLPAPSDRTRARIRRSATRLVQRRCRADLSQQQCRQHPSHHRPRRQPGRRLIKGCPNAHNLTVHLTDPIRERAGPDRRCLRHKNAAPRSADCAVGAAQQDRRQQQAQEDRQQEAQEDLRRDRQRDGQGRRPRIPADPGQVTRLRGGRDRYRKPTGSVIRCGATCACAATRAVRERSQKPGVVVPLTAVEERWLEQTVKRLIKRLLEHASGGSVDTRQ